MSGLEAPAVLGSVSSVLTIFDKSRQVFEQAKDARGLNETFRKVADRMPVVHDTLRDAKEINAQNRAAMEGATDANVRLMTNCEENVRIIEEIFEKAIVGDDAGRMQRYKKAVYTVASGKQRRVEELMKEVLESLQVLYAHQIFKDGARSSEKRVSDALGVVDQLPSSFAGDNNDRVGRQYNQYGSGKQTNIENQNNYGRSK